MASSFYDNIGASFFPLSICMLAQTDKNCNYNFTHYNFTIVLQGGTYACNTRIKKRVGILRRYEGVVRLAQK